jgi:hypothetical protein
MRISLDLLTNYQAMKSLWQTAEVPSTRTQTWTERAMAASLCAGIATSARSYGLPNDINQGGPLPSMPIDPLGLEPFHEQDPSA